MGFAAGAPQPGPVQRLPDPQKAAGLEAEEAWEVGFAAAPCGKRKPLAQAGSSGGSSHSLQKSRGPQKNSEGLYSKGLDWIGVAWIGLAWSGLAWNGLVWCDLE